MVEGKAKRTKALSQQTSPRSASSSDSRSPSTGNTATTETMASPKNTRAARTSKSSGTLNPKASRKRFSSDARTGSARLLRGWPGVGVSDMISRMSSRAKSGYLRKTSTTSTNTARRTSPSSAATSCTRGNTWPKATDKSPMTLSRRPPLLPKWYRTRALETPEALAMSLMLVAPKP